MKTISAVLAAAFVGGFVPHVASSQTVCDPWGNCITLPKRPDPGHETPTYERPDPGAAERRARKQEKNRLDAEAHRLNEEGITAWNEGKWTLALEKFRRAGGPYNKNKTIHANYLAALYRVIQDDIEKGNWEYAHNNCQSGLLYEPKLKELKSLCAVVGPKHQELMAAIDAHQAANRAFNRSRDLAKQGAAAHDKGEYALAERLFLEAAKTYPDEPQWMKNVAICRNKQGDQIFKGYDTWYEALRYWTAALEADPDNAYAKRRVEEGRKTRESDERDRLAALESERWRAQQEQDRLSRDVAVVDARNLPSGLPPDQERAIATAYKNAPPGVVERVERGFQAVNKRDWVVAHAWFGDALRRDPYNIGLRNLVSLAAYSQDTTAFVTTQPSVPVAPPATPQKAEIDLFFRNFREGRPQEPSDAVRRYVLSLSNDEFKRLLGQLQPTGKGLDQIFDLLEPVP